ncbi:MAG TPA: serine/threonine-protein kinase [Polyangia bacterium]|nr:serine/threonine-protein kinase [Polyangia bacterium]
MGSTMRSQPFVPSPSPSAASSEPEDHTALTKQEEPDAVTNQHTPWNLSHAPEPGSWGGAADLGRLEERYELYEEIARGGMATVHLGRSVEPGVPRVVAIKQLHSQLAWNPSFVAMFLDEGRLAARVHHPNVVAPLDFVVRQGQGELCLVMEYVHGETLSQLQRRAIAAGRTTAPAIAAGIMIGVLRGLHAAHEATTDDGTPLQIVHRDVSPQNVMVGTDGVARVLDFGVARAKMQDLPTGERDRGGKPAYLAPEQIRFQKIDRRADLFSAGVILWELLTGRRLFRHNDPRMVWVNILSGDIQPPSRFNPAVSPALDLVVLQALERDRARRPPTARAFAQAISDAIDPAGATEIGHWVKSVSGTMLARRAERVAEIMGRAQHKPAASSGARRLSAAATGLASRLAGRLASLVSLRGRGTTPGLLLAALAGMAISSGSSRALLRGTPSVASGTHEAPHRAPQIVPSPPPSIVTLSQVAPAQTQTPPQQEPPPQPKIDVPPSPAARVETGPRAEAPPAAADQETAGDVDPGVDEEEPLVEDAPTVFTVEDGGGPGANRRQSPGPRSAVEVRRRALARIALLNSRAMDAYQRARFESARGLLRTALATCASGRLQRHPIAATTHAFLGVVLIGGFNQSEMGVEQFRQALRIDPNVPLSRRWAKPTVAAAFRQAVART